MKQRFIDANKLNVDYVKANTATNTMLAYISKEQVENAPTVDAIPVEFIRRFVMFNPPCVYTTYEYGDEFFDEDAWCNDLIEDWKKKNE